MQCLSPIVIKNPRFGKFPNEYQYHKVPCGKCESCLVNKQTSWFIRLKEEMKISSKTYFFTLTYNDESTNGNLSKRDIQLFIKSLREELRKEDIKLKYYLCGEYGPETQRPHYHGIFFLNSNNSKLFDFPKAVEEHWKNGFIMISDEVTDDRLKYVSGYFISKLWSPIDKEKCFSLCSKSLGKSYLSESNLNFHQADYSNRFYYPFFDKRLPLPRYFKERIFSDFQKSQFSKDCEIRSNDKYNEDLSKFQGDVNRLEKYYYDIRKDYALQIQRRHKKVKL